MSDFLGFQESSHGEVGRDTGKGFDLSATHWRRVLKEEKGLF